MSQKLHDPSPMLIRPKSPRHYTTSSKEAGSRPLYVVSDTPILIGLDKVELLFL